jgi:hypothetical protein
MFVLFVPAAFGPDDAWARVLRLKVLTMPRST